MTISKKSPIVPIVQSEVTSKKKNYVDRLEKALKPLSNIADEWENEGLDESRPFWIEKGTQKIDRWEEIELYCGRGGKTLITLQDAFAAREALTGKEIPKIKKAKIDARCVAATIEHLKSGEHLDIMHVTGCHCEQ